LPVQPVMAYESGPTTRQSKLAEQSCQHGSEQAPQRAAPRPDHLQWREADPGSWRTDAGG